MKRLLLLLLLPFFIYSYCFSQSKFSYKNNLTIVGKINEPIDITFKTTASPNSNSFDLHFGATFKDKNGTTLSIPGFYNGDGKYIVRFSSSQSVVWDFETYSTVPELSGKKGSISFKENENPEVLGMVIVDKENPNKFQYANGDPYFALAFELDWLFALDYGNKKGIPKTEKIITEVKNNGFNQVVMNVYAYDVGWEIAENVPEEYFYGKPDYSIFEGNNQYPNFNSLNLNFFNHFDNVIEHLNQNGIQAHIMIYVWNKKVNWPSMYSEADNRYFDYVIKRYQAFPNVIWDVSKEALDYGRCDIPYINERIERIRKNDAFKHLVTVHDYEYCRQEPDKVDFISVQNWRSDLYSSSVDTYFKHQDKPVMNIEHGGYEEGPYLSFTGNYVNPEACLIRNYQNLFAGLYSTYYWQDTSWNIVVYDPMDSPSVIKKPKFEYYKYLEEFFTRYSYHELYPTKQKLTTNSRIGDDNFASSGYPLTNGEDLFLYLIPSDNFQVNVVLPEPKNKKLDVVWFNPFTGEYFNNGETDYAMWKDFSSPWKNTYSILILTLN